ncbi:MAG: 7-carboxy-7-deazaguanine synthase QueE [Candidatus Hadarchaeota archaeon]
MVNMRVGYIGQIFNSIQGEGLCVGRRQVFVRFSGCIWDCCYCDTGEFRNTVGKCEVETKPGSMKFKNVKNLMTATQVLRHVKRLTTPDTHSVSLTGGEPLLAGDFLVEVAKECKRLKLKTYLETNGMDSKVMKSVLPHTDIAAVDVKLPEHEAVPREKWSKILEKELACTKLAAGAGVDTFVKIVVLSSTRASTITSVCKKLSHIGVPVVLQPVTPARKIKTGPSMTHVYHLSEAAARAGAEVSIIPQVHKLLGIP